MHPAGGGRAGGTAEPPFPSAESLCMTSDCPLTSEVAGRLEPGEVKGRRHGLPRDLCDAVHGAHEPQLDLLAVVHGILEKRERTAAMREEHDAHLCSSFHPRGQTITWNKSSDVVPKAL